MPEQLAMFRSLSPTDVHKILHIVLLWFVKIAQLLGSMTRKRPFQEAERLKQQAS
jgi:hypothetical protein